MKVVIIGGDAAGMSAASQVKRRRWDWEVIVLERGPHVSYAACGIPYYLAGDVARFEDLTVMTAQKLREERGLDVRVGWEVKEVDVASRTVAAVTDAGAWEILPYDRLLLATGASPIVPRWPGRDLEGVVSIRGLADCARLEGLLERGARRAVVVGAGYVGLEMVEALRRRGLEVVLVEKLPGALGGAEPKVTERVLEELAEHGVRFRFDTEVTGFDGGGGRLRVVETVDGPIEADLALVALGVKPNVELAQQAGIRLGDSGALHVDSRQRTAVPDVWAAGDCAEANHLVLGHPTWMPLALTANRQGRVAGANIAGADECFPGIVGSAVTRVFALTLARTGIDEAMARAQGVPCQAVESSAPSRAHYYPEPTPLWVKLVFRSDNHKLLGAWLVGRSESASARAGILAAALTAGMTVDQLAGLDLCYAPPFSPVWDPVLQAANRARFALQAKAVEMA